MHADRLFACSIAAVLIAAVHAASAIGQPASSIERGPGAATASRVETASATVTAIDMATRQVTLRRDNGSTFTVVAGPDVRNLPQLSVGDTVRVDFYDALTLELKKGGTGAPASRADTVTGSRAELGQRPGGIATRERVIVADVVAVDATGQAVSLRGPGVRVVVLALDATVRPVRNSSRTSAAASTIRTSTRPISAATSGHLSAVTAGAARSRRASTTSSRATGSSIWTSGTSGLTMMCASTGPALTQARLTSTRGCSALAFVIASDLPTIGAQYRMGCAG